MTESKDRGGRMRNVLISVGIILVNAAIIAVLIDAFVNRR